MVLVFKGESIQTKLSLECSVLCRANLGVTCSNGLGLHFFMLLGREGCIVQ